jgi:hypothetical protein
MDYLKIINNTIQYNPRRQYCSVPEKTEGENPVIIR